MFQNKRLWQTLVAVIVVIVVIKVLCFLFDRSLDWWAWTHQKTDYRLLHAEESDGNFVAFFASRDSELIVCYRLRKVDFKPNRVKLSVRDAAGQNALPQTIEGEALARSCGPLFRSDDEHAIPIPDDWQGPLAVKIEAGRHEVSGRSPASWPFVVTANVPWNYHGESTAPKTTAPSPDTRKGVSR